MKLILIFCLAFSKPCTAQDSLLTVFWNVENFFDYRSEARPEFWTRTRFITKSNAIAKTLFRIADNYGSYPDIIALAEVENRFVLWYLSNYTLLRKLEYEIIHFDSPDHRGIDCALLYRRKSLNLREAQAKHLYNGQGESIASRDILIAEFDSLAILVNHHPSKVRSDGTDKAGQRKTAMDRMMSLVDSLQCEKGMDFGILCVGDFNEELWDSHKSAFSTAPGSIKYNGKWEKIDGHFLFGDIGVSEEIFDDRSLLVPDRNFGGLKPKRTFTGPRYEGGISDHLPLVLSISL